MGRSKEQIIDAFMSRVMPEPNTGCWIWIGSMNHYGYGQCSLAYAGFAGAHRTSYALFVAQPVPGLDVDHMCRNRICCNPIHLRLVTRKENMHGHGGIAMRGLNIQPKHTDNDHCRRGHARVPINTVTRGIGRGTPREYCRECERENTRRSEKKKRESIKAMYPNRVSSRPGPQDLEAVRIANWKYLDSLASSH